MVPFGAFEHRLCEENTMYQKKIFDMIFLLCANATGFFVPVLLYPLGIFLKVIEFDTENTNPLLLQLAFLQAVNMTWLVCAFFSLAFLMIQDKIRWVFIIAPVLIPLLYGTMTLFKLQLL